MPHASTQFGKTYAIVVAAGTGTRAGTKLPKQYCEFAGKPMLQHSVEAFCSNAKIDNVVVVIGRGQEEMARNCLGDLKDVEFVTGGDTRRQSVFNALKMINELRDASQTLIHDAARPGISQQMINTLVETLDVNDAAVPALPVVDSLTRSESDVMTATVERASLVRIQTPQAFAFTVILNAHLHWDSEVEATDDARMVQAVGGKVVLVRGDEQLKKVTFADDFQHENGTMTGNSRHIEYRSGQGFDVHRLVAGKPLWLCGVEIPHAFGLSGHSDADVALHAITDALLGTIAAGDIGDHFPPSDPQWKGASSDLFLKHAASLIRAKAGSISNIDLTIMCEEPKIGPHRLAMRRKIAEILEISLDRVSVKATTTEKLGFTGRGEGIAAQAIANIALFAE